MLTKKKYNRLSIHEKINYRAELKNKNIKRANSFDFAIDLAKTAISFLENMNNDHKKRTAYQLIK